jgi:tetratricopeptide (TPR) repeat protein
LKWVDFIGLSYKMRAMTPACWSLSRLLLLSSLSSWLLLLLLFIGRTTDTTTAAAFVCTTVPAVARTTVRRGQWCRNHRKNQNSNSNNDNGRLLLWRLHQTTTPAAPQPTPRFFMDDTPPLVTTSRMANSSSMKSDGTSSSTTTTTAVHELIAGDIGWNSLVGEADRAFRHGIQLEKNGQARKAAAYFHEAATLYQCALDRPKEFGPVTSLSFADGRSILAYACLSLAFLNMDVLKNPMAASRLFRLAGDNVPTAVSLDGMGMALEAADAPLLEAVKAYRQALEYDPGNAKVRFHLAVALERLGTSTSTSTVATTTTTTTTTAPTTAAAATDSETTTTSSGGVVLDGTTTDDDSTSSTSSGSSSSYSEEADGILDALRREPIDHSCLVDSWGYVRYHTRKIRPYPNLYQGTREMLELAINHALINDDALICEFGVGSGRSLRLLQEIVELSQQIHGFDTFTGLPQAWGSVPAGTYSTGGIVPTMEGKVVFHKGLFRDTIPPFLAESKRTAFLSYANIDCRLYSSTVDILEALYARVVPGTIIVFSGYTCHGTWRQDLFRAWRECCKRFGWKYDYLGFSLSTKQAVVRVTHA